MDNRLILGVVHIVEWLGPSDARTGRELFDELEPLAIMAKPQVEVKYWPVATRDDFLSLLPILEQEYQATGRAPLLHIETHGTGEGIGPCAELRWPELMEALIRFNRLTRLNLVVILAACEGFWGVQMLQLDRPAAFRGLIGPHREVSARKLGNGCLAFYRTVFTSFDGDAALKAMNAAADPEQETFWLISAETAFKLAYQGYLETQCTPEAIESRLDKIVENIGAMHRANGHGCRFSAEIARDRENARLLVTDHRAHFDKRRGEFFFLDLYPENDGRFDFTFEDCQPRP